MTIQELYDMYPESRNIPISIDVIQHYLDYDWEDYPVAEVTTEECTNVYSCISDKGYIHLYGVADEGE